MKRPPVLAIAVAFLTVWVVMAACITAVWLTEEVRVVGLVILPTAVVASLLVLYFDWRSKLQRRALGERDERLRSAEGRIVRSHALHEHTDVFVERLGGASAPTVANK